MPRAAPVTNHVLLMLFSSSWAPTLPDRRAESVEGSCRVLAQSSHHPDLGPVGLGANLRGAQMEMLDELRALIERHCGAARSQTAIGGVTLRRATAPTVPIST